MEHTHHHSPEEHHHHEKKEDAKFTLSVPAAIIVAGLIIAGAIFATRVPVQVGNDVQDGKQKVSINIKDVSLEGEPYVGKADATPIAYFSDYQCPFCKKFETTEMQEIVSKYVSTGKVRIVFKDFVFLGPDSTEAAVFGRAVWKLYPEQYFAWREAMYAAQDDEGGIGFGDRESIEELTRAIVGVDQKKVSADVDANRVAYEALIKADYDEALRLGITGTPAVIIGKSVVSGAHLIAEYEKALDKVVR